MALAKIIEIVAKLKKWLKYRNSWITILRARSNQIRWVPWRQVYNNKSYCYTLLCSTWVQSEEKAILKDHNKIQDSEYDELKLKLISALVIDVGLNKLKYQKVLVEILNITKTLANIE